MKPWALVQCVCLSLWVQAEDFERRIAGPRWQRKLEEADKKMRYIRGFGGEGNIVGGGDSQGADGRGVSRLLQVDQSQEVAASHDTDSKVTASHESSQSSDGDHVTDDDITDGDQSGKLVWVAVRAPNRTVRSQFYTSQTMKVSTI